MRETQVLSLGGDDTLQKEMTPHSSTLAWKIPWMEEPHRLQSMGSQRVRHNWATSLFFVTASDNELNFFIKYRLFRSSVSSVSILVSCISQRKFISVSNLTGIKLFIVFPYYHYKAWRIGPSSIPYIGNLNFLFFNWSVLLWVYKFYETSNN